MVFFNGCLDLVFRGFLDSVCLQDLDISFLLIQRCIINGCTLNHFDLRFIFFGEWKKTADKSSHVAIDLSYIISFNYTISPIKNYNTE